MSDDEFDDGLVHDHAWANHSQFARKSRFPIADVRHVRTPSTVHQDDWIATE